MLAHLAHFWFALFLIGELAYGSEAMFRQSVAPVLESRCLRCHSGTEPKGGLSLETSSQLLQGGDSGPAIVAGAPEDSLLLESIAGDEPAMPKDGAPLSPAEVAAIREWIAAGAPWADDIRLRDKKTIDLDWWSLKPLVESSPPAVESDWVRTPIDAFILTKLREHHLSPADEADRRTLIRRLYFDLIGLPPAPDEVASFVDDRSPQAYEKLVDRLLASPRYGERWGRHWLDVVHYGDTHGYDKDKVRPNAWPYRDYVIRALNDDKPYARFVEEQLAGDVLYPDTSDGIVATGFIVAGPFDYVGQIEVAEGTLAKAVTRNLDRDDMVATTIGTFNSMTAHCSRCHHHKFDPISQEDYYSLQAVFAGVDRADRPYDADGAVAARRHRLAVAIAALEAARARNAEQSPHALANLSPKQDRLLDDVSHESLERLDRELAALRKELESLPEPSVVFAAATDFKPEGTFVPTKSTARPVYILNRGNENDPLRQAVPGTCAYVPQLASRFELAAGAGEGARRVALARWIVDKRNPLTWRSIVNRVWQYHFGRGIVDSPNDFGRMGALPTHPELLDWLAIQFRDGGQSLKELHRLICTSAVYRQSSSGNPQHQARDGANQFLWRMNRRKLEAEAVRDAVLRVAGKLDLTAGGPGFRAFGFVDDHSPHYKYDEYDPDDPATHRRSVYRFIVRSVPDPLMAALDCADSSAVVPKRNETLTPLQALAMFNNPFMVRMAEHFATRVEGLGPDTTTRLAVAWNLALARKPRPDELAPLVEYAEHHGLPSACRLIFNLNEFVFID